ncbi:hypothetical protein L1987_48350 [Smallanthus sonchifolius]|uniref:Uncharacterized protein n=1 Tax=Smallanthus sonchifolius TaxID=185202 RepID=A0ACB9FSL2_9ASTR|nr:hypothetical protein L1987_48350 [Smallanthus sonchifolius]
MAQRYSGKGKGKEVPDPVKQRASKDYKLMDEEFLNFATQETTNTISKLKTQVSNLQSREAANEREIRELKTSDSKKQKQLDGQQVHIDNLQSIVQDLVKRLGMSISIPNVTNQPMQENKEQQGPSTLNQSQHTESPIKGADLFGSQDMFDVDSLINQQGEGMEVGDDDKEKEEDEKEEDEDVIITDIKKIDDDPSDYDDSSSDGSGIGGSGANNEESSDDKDSNVIYEKHEYEEKQTYVECDGNEVVRLDKVVDERIPFEKLFEESETDEAQKDFTKKKASYDKSSLWKINENPSTVERITQRIRNPRKALTGLILGWKFDNDKKMYVIKRVAGDIQYFDTSHKLQTLPRWDIRDLSRLKMINESNNTRASAFEVLLRNQCNQNSFTSFQPQIPIRRKIKKKYRTNEKIKYKYIVKPADTVTTVYIPERKRSFIKDFDKWFYDSSSHEAVIQQRGLPEVIIFDPMDLFSFSDEDLKILYYNTIQCDMSLMIKNEAKLYMKVVSRCLSLRAEARLIKKRL